MSEVESSIAPDKPPGCSSDTWRIIGDAVNESESLSSTQNFDNVQVLQSTAQENNNEILLLDLGESAEKSNSNVIIEIINVDNDGRVITVTNPQQTISQNDVLIMPLKDNFDQGNNTENFIEENSNLETNEENKERKRSKKGQANPAEWKQNVRRNNRQHGQEYINSKGKLIQKRSVQRQACCSKECPFHCSKKITEDERSVIHKSFWTLSDDKKLHFYSKHIKRKLAVRKRTNAETSKKAFSFEYYLVVSGVKMRVCQQYFLNTLNISKQRIYYFFKSHQNRSTEIPFSPRQGKHQKKVTPEEKKNEVRAHIRSFPTVSSHYCRASTNKQYLERNLNLRRMYELYQQENPEPLKFNLYAKIFKTDFNISFFKPKKDVCDKCSDYKENKNPTPEETTKYDEHINRKNIGNKERESDRIRYKTDKTTAVITFDLQNTFSLPKSNVSKNFYKMKLSCYNLTAHCSLNQTVYNAIWHESLCGRGGIHIACALIKILKSVVKDNPQIKKIILWSDSCIAQNKNSIMSFALQHFMSSEFGKRVEVIEQKFGEPGHGNVQEVDCAHSCIERYIRHAEIWSPLTLIRLLLSMPTNWKQKFKILQMQKSDYFDFQLNASKYSYVMVPYTKVKHLIYEKECLINIKYRLQFEGPITTVKLQHNKRIYKMNQVEIPNVIPEIPYKKVALPEQKKKHLKEMLPQMPEEERTFYHAILGLDM